jgi:fructose 1,6-bisphosphatase
MTDEIFTAQFTAVSFLFTDRLSVPIVVYYLWKPNPGVFEIQIFRNSVLYKNLGTTQTATIRDAQERIAYCKF